MSPWVVRLGKAGFGSRFEKNVDSSVEELIYF
jgi:hypothetical protein